LRADWAEFMAVTERSMPTIPVNIVSVEESYTRLTGAIMKAAKHSIPRGFRPTYIPCLDEECQDLLRQYDESGDPDVTDHLIESLDAARQHRWEETTNQMDFTRSSRKSWALIRRLGAAQNPPKKNHPLVRANAVAAHLIRVAKAPGNKKFEHHSRDQRRQFLRHTLDKTSPPPFTTSEIDSALKLV
jgi:hypothetical protein